MHKTHFDYFGFLRALEASDLPPLPTLLLMVIARSTDKETGKASGRDVSITALIRRTRYSRDSVVRGLGVAESAGWLARATVGDSDAKRSGRRNTYRLLVPKPVDNPQNQSDHRTGSDPDQSDYQTGSGTDQSDSQTATSPTIGLHQSDSRTPDLPSSCTSGHTSLVSARVRKALAEVAPDLTDDDEITAFIEKIERQHPGVRNLAAWLLAVGKNGDLPALIDDMRHERATGPQTAVERPTTGSKRVDKALKFLEQGHALMAKREQQQAIAGASPKRNGYQPYRNPIDQSAYDEDMY